MFTSVWQVQRRYFSLEQNCEILRKTFDDRFDSEEFLENFENLHI